MRQQKGNLQNHHKVSLIHTQTDFDSIQGFHLPCLFKRALLFQIILCWYDFLWFEKHIVKSVFNQKMKIILFDFFCFAQHTHIYNHLVYLCLLFLFTPTHLVILILDISLESKAVIKPSIWFTNKNEYQKDFDFENKIFSSLFVPKEKWLPVKFYSRLWFSYNFLPDWFSIKKTKRFFFFELKNIFEKER
jgi:hypothetical protein